MPRFVILEHDYPQRHWDLMLEAGEVLKTWRLLSPPDGTDPIPMQVAPDHRGHYLEYEGPISGGRGSVIRWDAGECQWEARTPEQVIVVLWGERIRGRVLLTAETNGKWSFQRTVASRQEPA